MSSCHCRCATCALQYLAHVGSRRYAQSFFGSGWRTAKHWPVSDADDIDDTGALLSHILGHRDSCAPQAPEIRRQRWQRHQLRQKGSHPAALCGCVIMDSVRETRRDLLLRLCRLNQDFRNGYARVAAFVYWVSVLVRGGQFRNHGKTTYSADDSRVLNLFRHNAT